MGTKNLFNSLIFASIIIALKIFVFHHSSWCFKECGAGTVIRWFSSATEVAVQRNRQLGCHLHSGCSTKKQTTKLSSAWWFQYRETRLSSV